MLSYGYYYNIFVIIVNINILFIINFLVVAVFVLLLMIIITVHITSTATIIKSPGGWSSMEGSNFTLGCWVSLTNNNMNADTVCRTRIRFTKNSTSIAEGPRHIRSGSTRDVNTNRINCTMTIFRLRSEDSGMYGCCWPDVAGICSRHPTKMLTVMPALTGGGYIEAVQYMYTGSKQYYENKGGGTV